MIIDNFALSTHQTCPRKYQHRIIEGWSSRGDSSALVAGAALHAGLAAWNRGEGLVAAFAAINEEWNKRPPLNVTDWRTLPKVLATMRQYADHWGQESFRVVGLGTDQALVERAYTLDTGLTLPDGEPIEYGGILDTVVEFNDAYYILEHKTTSVMGAGFWQQFKPNNQITGYIWAAMQLSDKPIKGAIVNAIGWFKAGATRLERQITTRTPEEIEEWKQNLVQVCAEIRGHTVGGYYPQRTAACTIYGRCTYHGVCEQSPSIREALFSQDFVADKWDHATRDEAKDSK